MLPVLLATDDVLAGVVKITIMGAELTADCALIPTLLYLLLATELLAVEGVVAALTTCEVEAVRTPVFAPTPLQLPILKPLVSPFVTGTVPGFTISSLGSFSPD